MCNLLHTREYGAVLFFETFENPLTFRGKNHGEIANVAQQSATRTLQLPKVKPTGVRGR